jgi:hypothetical protein
MQYAGSITRVNAKRLVAKIALWTASAGALISLSVLALLAFAPGGEAGFIPHMFWTFASLPLLVLFPHSQSVLSDTAPNLFSFLVIAFNALFVGAVAFLIAVAFVKH